MEKTVDEILKEIDDDFDRYVEEVEETINKVLVEESEDPE